MKRMLAVSLALAVCMAFALSASAFNVARPGGEPPPSDCSPGYWKNHTDVWMGEGCGIGAGPLGGDILDGRLLDMLTPQGELGSKADRERAAFILNSCGLVSNCK